MRIAMTKLLLLRHRAPSSLPFDWLATRYRGGMLFAAIIIVVVLAPVTFAI